MRFHNSMAQIIVLIVCAISFYSSPAVANEQAAKETIAEIERILQLPEDKIDLAYTRFLIETVLYTGVSVSENLAKLDSIVTTIKGMPEYGDSSLERLGTTLRYLYTPASWNNSQAYAYDLDDPFGTKRPQGKSVANYLNTKKGNCVSMPILLALISERLGVNVHLSHAPHHVFVRYTDEQGIVTNIETTSGTLLPDQKYIKAFEIQPEAVKNGIYLQDLSKKEAVVVMSYDVGRMLMHNGQFKEAHEFADMMLHYYPKFVNAMLLKGNLYSMQLQQELASLKAANVPITQAERLRLDPLYEQNLAWFAKAESLGWREPSPDFAEKYARSVEEFKKNN